MAGVRKIWIESKNIALQKRKNMKTLNWKYAGKGVIMETIRMEPALNKVFKMLKTVELTFIKSHQEMGKSYENLPMEVQSRMEKDGEAGFCNQNYLNDDWEKEN